MNILKCYIKCSLKQSPDLHLSFPRKVSYPEGLRVMATYTLANTYIALAEAADVIKSSPIFNCSMQNAKGSTGGTECTLPQHTWVVTALT